MIDFVGAVSYRYFFMLGKKHNLELLRAMPSTAVMPAVAYGYEGSQSYFFPLLAPFVLRKVR